MPTILRVRFALFVAPLVALCAAVPAGAQSYPSRPIRFICASPAGGPADIVTRSIAPKLYEAWGQPVVIDNRAGANGIVGTEITVRSAPDGYTIVTVAAGLAINPSLYGRVPYDPVRDLAPITQAISVANVLVAHPSVPVRTVEELVALAKAKPRTLTFATAGNGSSGHLAAELFKQTAKVDLIHVPYKGGGPAITDLLGGQVNVLFSLALGATPHVKSGRLRALGVTSARRIAPLPEVPTIAESGYPGYEVVGWFGVLAPAATPAAILGRLHAEIVRILGLADVHERLAAQGADIVASRPEQFGAYIRAEQSKWAKVIREAGIKAE